MKFVYHLNKYFIFFFILFYFNLTQANSYLKAQEKINTGEDISLEGNKNNFNNVNLSYLLGPGDILKINFLDAEEFSGEFKILNDGSISLPFTSEVKLSGLNINQARDSIQIVLSDYLLRPEINLKIIKTRPIRYSVIGEVTNPGIYKSSELITLVDAIRNAGGLTTYSNLRKVKLIRQVSINKNLESVSTNLDLISIIVNGKQNQNLFLFDGDVIKIQKANLNNKESNNIVSNNLLPDKINVYVIGEVTNPGLLKIPAKTTLNQAILTAGGPNFKSTKEVKLHRVNKDGSYLVKKYKYRPAIKYSSEKNPFLLENDTIQVGKKTLAKISDQLNIVSDPALKILNVYSLYNLTQ